MIVERDDQISRLIYMDFLFQSLSLEASNSSFVTGWVFRFW